MLNGTAAYVVGGAVAELLLVSSASRIALIERTAPGVESRPSDIGIGLEAAGFADITFDHAEAEALAVPAAAVDVATDLSLILALAAAAGAQAALGLTVEYVRERTVFGVPLATLQNTRRVTAQMAASVDAALTFAESCLHARIGDSLTVARAAAAAQHCIEAYRRVVDAGVQLHGGYGYILEYPIAHAYADAQFWELHGGLAPVRSEEIAAALLG